MHLSFIGLSFSLELSCEYYNPDINFPTAKNIIISWNYEGNKSTCVLYDRWREISFS